MEDRTDFAEEDCIELGYGYRLIQPKNGLRSGTDAVFLAHFANQTHPDQAKIMDIGCGTGPIALLLHALNPDAEITAVEIQPALAALAKRNVSLNHAANIHVLCEDFRQLPIEMHNQYTLLVSNPPFFPLNGGMIPQNPSRAIARHEISCTLSDLLQSAAKLLIEGGKLCIVYPPNRLPEIFALAPVYRLYATRLRVIYPREHQNANLILLELTKSKKGTFIIQPPCIIYDAAGNFTAEVRSYFGGDHTCKK